MQAKKEKVTEVVQGGKVGEQDDTTTEEENPLGAPQKRKTQSVTALKKALTEAKIKEQQQRYDEATKWSRATEEGLGDVDLEQEMEQLEQAETTSAATTATTMVTTMAMASSSMCMVTTEVYAKPYAKMTESRGEQSTARSEKKEAKEREVMFKKQKDEEDRLVKEKEADQQCKVVEHVLLGEEEKSQAEVLRKMREKEEKRK